MDKNFIEKNGLTESLKRFNRIVEYTNAAGAFITEDGENDMEDPNAEQMLPMDNNEMAPQMGENDMEDPNAEQMPPMDNGANGEAVAEPEGFAPQETNEMEPEEEEDEEVIDVDDLTDAQEKTEDKIDKLTSKFEKLISKIEDFENQIDASNKKIETLKSDIKAEIEKRNPTPVEKLSLRSKNSYPFNITPGEYWKEKEATSNYSTQDDENGANDTVYKITKDEIDNFNNYADVSRTFDDYDLRNMFGY